MRKLASLFVVVIALVAIFGVSTVSAQKTIATVEKLWSRTLYDIGATIANTRQGVGRDGNVYLLNKVDQSFVAVSESSVDTIFQGPLEVEEGVWAILDGTAYALDDAGNFVMEGTFPSIPSHLVLRKADGSVVKDLAITGLRRTDFINATGDVFSAEGGYVFVYGNSADLLVYTIANGALVGEPTTVAVAGVGGGGNYVIAGDEKVQIVHHRSSGSWKKIDNGVATALDMPGHKATTLGGDIITLAGKEFYIYPAGSTNYSSEFSVRNMTDGTLVTDKDGATILCSNTLTTANSTILACWLNVSKIDDNSAYIHVYNADGVAVFKLNLVPAATVALACDTTMGSVEGAADYAIGSNVTVKAIPALGHSFVAWLNGADTVSTKAEYTFEVKEDVALTAVFQKEENKKLTLAVNDATMGTITLPEGIVMGENTVVYGTKVALTAIPAEGCTFTGWTSGDAAYSAEYTIEVALTADLALTANYTKVLKLEYDLGGGVTNAHGWLSKAHMCLDFQNDYNTAYSSTKAWAKEENGVVYYYINGAWKLPEEVVGTAADVTGFIQNVTYNTSDNLVKLLQTEKWLPLGDYINNLRVAAGNAVADETAMRADLSGFFLNSPSITDFRKTNDYTIAGQPAAFCPVMKMGFDNPTEVAFEVTLNDPYRAEFIFAGWYTTADFSGEKVTKLSPESVIAGGKLYAKWEKAVICDVYSADTTKGSVKGGGEYDINATTIISAIPAYGYHFLRWNDGNTDNPREVILTEDVTYTAEFEANTYMLTAVANDEVMGSVIGGGEYLYMTQAKLVASANEHYRFVQWSDGVAANPRFIIVTQDTTFTAEFEVEVFNLWVASSEPNKGRVKVTLTAEPIEGFEFLEWSDGNQENPRVFYPTEDMQLFAYFQLKSSTPTDIESATISKAKVWGEKGILHVEGANSDYCVLDTAGKLIYRGRQPMISLPVGVYVVTLAGEIEKVVL